MTTTGFEPDIGRHLAALNACLQTAMQRVAELNKEGILLGRKRYTTVAQRNEVFREVFGLQGRILTQILEATDTVVTAEATIQFFLAGEWMTVANGFAEERRNASTVNKTSALENAETSAVGRALANLGLHGGEYASANEVENAIHQQQETKSPRPGETLRPVPAVAGRITEDQVLDLSLLIGEAGADLDKFLGHFGVEQLSHLPADQYARAVHLLEKKRRDGGTAS